MIRTCGNEVRLKFDLVLGFRRDLDLLNRIVGARKALLEQIANVGDMVAIADRKDAILRLGRALGDRMAVDPVDQWPDAPPNSGDGEGLPGRQVMPRALVSRERAAASVRTSRV